MRKLHFFSTLVALLFATSTLWADKTYIDDGKLPGAFTVQNSPKKVVYFSQGNLEYIGSATTPYWKFADEQYEYFGNNGQNNDGENIDRDLFGWGTKTNPWNTSTEASDYSWNEWGENAISNGGNAGKTTMWRSLTRAEWSCLYATRTPSNNVNGTTPALYTLATINTNTTPVKGMILFPDDANLTTVEGVTWGTFNSPSDYTTTCTTAGWEALETAGCVFLPAAGIRDGDEVKSVGSHGRYWPSSAQSGSPYWIGIQSTKIYNQTGAYAYYGMSVRLVSETAPKQPSSISVLPEADPSEITYDGEEHTLLSTAGTAVGGTMKYSFDNEHWSSVLPKATDAGTYTIYYMVKGDATHKDYTPEPNTITVTINKADIDVSGLSVTGNEIVANGNLQELVSVTGSFTGGTLNYSLDGESWNTSIPTASAASEYNVYFKIVGDVNHNDYTPNPAYVTAIIDLYPFVADNADPTAKLAEFAAAGSMDLKVKRTIWADGEYNTICLPFTLDASALAASPLAGYDRLKTFKGARVSGTGQDLYIDIFVEDATEIEAGVPYLITYPAGNADIVNPVFTGITVTTTPATNVSADGVTFQGMFGPKHINPYETSRDEDYLFLGANSQLMWPADGDVSYMRGFRAYFIIDRTAISAAHAPKGTRARIVDAPKTTTDIDIVTDPSSATRKVLENGTLIIIKNGVKYNAQGQVVK